MDERIILFNFLSKYENKTNISIYHIIKEENINIVEVDELKEINGLYTQKNGKDYIFISKDLPEQIKKFTLAHEFCHYLLGERGLSLSYGYSRTYIEKRADDFAMKLLLPKKAVLEAINEYGNIPTLVEIFGVPENIIEKRLSKLI